MPIEEFREPKGFITTNIILALGKETSLEFALIFIRLDYLKSILKFENQQLLNKTKLKLLQDTKITDAEELSRFLKDLDQLGADTCALELQKMANDLAKIDSAEHEIQELAEVMHQFYLNAKKENAELILKAFAAKSKLFDSLTVTTDDQLTVTTLKDLQDEYHTLHSKLRKKLQIVINKFDGFLGFYGNVEKMVVKRLERDLYAQPLVKEHLVMAFNQMHNPVIDADEGYCFGIGLGVSNDLLSNGDPKNLKTATQLQESILFDIAKYQEAFCNREVDMSKMDELAKQKALAEKDKIAQYLQVFVNDFDANHLRPAAFTKHIANEVSKVFEDIKPDDNYAIELSLEPNHAKGIGHSLSIVHKDNIFYFVDANSGLFSFASSEQLQMFLTWYLNTTGYTTCHSRLYLNNYPQLEASYPIPDSLKSKATNGKFSMSRNDNSNYTYLKDKAYEARAIAYAIYAVTFGQVTKYIPTFRFRN